MKTFKRKLWLLGIPFLIFGTIMSCEKKQLNVGEIQLQEKITAFTSSTVFTEFTENFPDQSRLINYQSAALNQTTPDVETIHLALEQEGRLVGRIVGFPIPLKGGFQLIYESFEEFDGNSGLIKQFTSKGNFIADFKVVAVGDKALYSLNDIGNNLNKGKLRLKASTQSTVPIEEEVEDGWWDCTTKCYRDAKDACGSDTTCDFLCDIANLLGQCTISIAAACAIHCM